MTDLETMASCLRAIWEMVGDAELNHKGRISKDQRIAIMMNCAAGLGIDVHKKRQTADVLPFPSEDK